MVRVFHAVTIYRGDLLVSYNYVRGDMPIRYRFPFVSAVRRDRPGDDWILVRAIDDELLG